MIQLNPASCAASAWRWQASPTYRTPQDGALRERYTTGCERETGIPGMVPRDTQFGTNSRTRRRPLLARRGWGGLSPGWRTRHARLLTSGARPNSHRRPALVTGPAQAPRKLGSTERRSRQCPAVVQASYSPLEQGSRGHSDAVPESLFLRCETLASRGESPRLDDYAGVARPQLWTRTAFGQDSRDGLAVAGALLSTPGDGASSSFGLCTMS